MGEEIPPDSNFVANTTSLDLSPAVIFSSNGIAVNPKRLRTYPRPQDPQIPIDSPDQTFDDCRTIEGWTDMILKLLHAAWDDPNSVSTFQFSHDFNLLGKDPQDLLGAVIVYEIISEEPAKMGSKVEAKPRVRQVLPGNDGQKTWVWAQSFDVVVAFNVYGDSWDRAIDTTDRFKELMATYFGIFKQFGLQEIFYKGQMRDALYDPPKVQEFPNRTLFYAVRVERQWSVNYAQIEQLLIRAGILSEGSTTVSDSITAQVTGVSDSPILPAQ